MNIDASLSFSSLPNTRICRICHIVERGAKSVSQLSIKGKPVDDSFSKVLTIISKFLIGIDFQKRSTSDDEMIAPCKCKGTMRFVHRGCLNQWRAVSGRNDSFQRCEQCFAQYTFNEGFISKLLVNNVFILCVTALIFWCWILASMLVTTSAEAAMFNLLPKISDEFDRLPLRLFKGFLRNSSESVLLLSVIHSFNSLMDQASRLFYGLVFVAITEFIFLTPSFLLSFNILFCVWRIQKYEIFFDKWLLAALTLFGVFSAWRSIEGAISNMANRAIKLWFLEVQNHSEIESVEKED